MLYGPLRFINPLNAQLNPICHLMALLGAHHIFHVSGLRVNETLLILQDLPLYVSQLLNQLTDFHTIWCEHCNLNLITECYS